jgi:hypothetical protein
MSETVLDILINTKLWNEIVHWVLGCILVGASSR